MSKLKNKIPTAGPDFRNLEMAPSIQSDTYSTQVKRIMEYMGISTYFISDESTFSDLPLFEEDGDYDKISEHFGLTIKPDDYVVKIAIKLSAN